VASGAHPAMHQALLMPRQNGFVLRGGLPPGYRGLRGEPQGEPRRATR
jgi:hypothetical protein